MSHARDLNPMRVLGDALGVPHPRPVTGHWVLVSLWLAPIFVLTVIGVLLGAGTAQNIVFAFVSAFAGLQLAPYYAAATKKAAQFARQARESNRSVSEHFVIYARFAAGPRTYLGLAPVGYRGWQLVLAQLRFLRLQRRWARQFRDVVRGPVLPGRSLGPSAIRRAAGPRVDWSAFVLRGRWMSTRTARLLFAALAICVRWLWDRSGGLILDEWRDRRAQHLLTVVGREICQATADVTADDCVENLASQLGLIYRKSSLNSRTLFSAASGGSLPRD